jgi:hypothetical protein
MYEVETPPEPVARAYVYNGDWVADCPRPGLEPGKAGCGNVEFLFTPSRMNGPRDTERTFYLCSYCGMQGHIAWPRRREEIMMALMVRPVPSNRNWYPADHPVAVNFRIPHGQTVAELLEENEAHGVSNEPVRGLR